MRLDDVHGNPRADLDRSASAFWRRPDFGKIWNPESRAGRPRFPPWNWGWGRSRPGAGCPRTRDGRDTRHGAGWSSGASKGGPSGAPGRAPFSAGGGRPRGFRSARPSRSCRGATGRRAARSRRIQAGPPQVGNLPGAFRDQGGAGIESPAGWRRIPRGTRRSSRPRSAGAGRRCRHGCRAAGRGDAGLVDGPELPPAERRVAHDEHQRLHEAAVAGQALDLGDRRADVCRGSTMEARSRSSRSSHSARVQSFSARVKAGHVDVEQQLDAVERIQDAELGAEGSSAWVRAPPRSRRRGPPRRANPHGWSWAPIGQLAVERGDAALGTWSRQNSSR